MPIFKRMSRGDSHRLPVDNDQEIVLLVLGMTGTGKPSLIQSLTGEEARPEISEDEVDFATAKCAMHRVELDGVKIILIDTPGVPSDYRSFATSLAPIKQFLDENPLVQIHGILYTTKGDFRRIDQTDANALFFLGGVCGKPFFSNLTVILGGPGWDEMTPAGRENRLYVWKRAAWEYLPGCKVRPFDRGNPGAMLSHYSAMKRKGILGTKTPLLVAELRRDHPIPDATTSILATTKGINSRGKLRTREAWARKLRYWAAELRYCNPPAAS